MRTEKRNLRSYLSRRAEILSESLQESVEPLLDRLPKRNLQRLVERFGQREHLKGGAVYNSASAALAITPGQINHEVMHLARDLSTARAAAEEEARLRDSNASLWTAERLHVSLRSKLQDKPFFVVPNREVCQVG